MAAGGESGVQCPIASCSGGQEVALAGAGGAGAGRADTGNRQWPIAACSGEQSMAAGFAVPGWCDLACVVGLAAGFALARGLATDLGAGLGAGLDIFMPGMCPE
ncbi:hypothetical protein [Sphingomonas sp. Leaf231]|uniref:hypothetical protein n=1 Tax=Sphingomonas sp. Leaf231 TaxID=1736301 RepID=UPI001F476C7B|nr:hypothetical protein [Sphingomonas sp. Leaf231]